MTTITENLNRFDDFRTLSGFPLGEDHLHLDVLEWKQGVSEGIHLELQHARDLANRPPCSVRIVFAPLDLPDNSTARGLFSIINHYSIPTSFLSERIQSVAHSCGSQVGVDGSESAWFHFLCKNITVERNPENPRHVEIKNQNIRSDTKGLSQEDFSWIRAGFFLKSEPSRSSEPKMHYPGILTPSGDMQMGNDTVSLVCFGASEALKKRFISLVSQSISQEVLQEPYTLISIILEEVYLQMDSLSWSLSSVYGGMESRVLTRAQIPGHAAERIDFVGMHNIAKHVVYMRESFDAISHTVDALLAIHSNKSWQLKAGTTPSPVNVSVHRALLYRKGVFHSSNLRLKSMEKRVQNLIQLSFNLVAQQDSRVIQVDSKLMMLIALVTLVFLPSSTIASVFGSQFFVFNNDGNSTSPDLLLSNQFWLFWVISIPITCLVLLVGWLYFRRMKKDVIGAIQPKDGRTGTWMTDAGKKV
jgi:hypothetical protein